ncbi:MAG: hypothetical protein P1R58_08635 [bacterium]|nr:hypothetical protein [bacterium]
MSKSVDSAIEAVSIAHQFTGFSELASISNEKALELANVISVYDTTTPFLADEVSGCRIWKIVVEDVILDFNGWDPDIVAKNNPHTFEIWIDSASGRLLRAFTSSPHSDSEIPGEPNADSSTTHYPGERFIAFLSGPAPTNLYKALEAAAFCDPLQTREITAFLVRHSMASEEPRDRWIFHSRGQTPIKMHGYQSDQLARVRCAVDAVTGEPVFATMTR